MSGHWRGMNTVETREARIDSVNVSDDLIKAELNVLYESSNHSRLFPSNDAVVARLVS